MIIFDRNTKDLEIPAGLGNLEINVESRCEGVTSIDGQTGPVTLKTINGTELVGEGDIQIGANTYVLNLMSQEERVALYSELQQYRPTTAGSQVSSGFTPEDYNFYYYVQNGNYDSGGGFISLRLSAIRSDNGSEFFQGIIDGYVGRNFKYISVVLREDGTISGSEGYPCVYTINGQKGELNLKTINGNALLGTGDIEISGTTLPIASADTLGGVKIGEGISIDENGVISTSGGSGGVTSGEVQTMIDSALTDYSTTAQTQEAIASALTDYATTADTQGEISSALTDYSTTSEVNQAISNATENMVTSTHIGIIWVGTSQQYADISPKDPNTLYFINDN